MKNFLFIEKKLPIYIKSNLRGQFYQSKMKGLSCSEVGEPFRRDLAHQLGESTKKP